MTEKPTFAGVCETEGLVVQSSEVDMVFSILAVHSRKCNKKHWAETYSQYLARVEMNKRMAELKAKQKEAFKSGKDQIE